MEGIWRRRTDCCIVQDRTFGNAELDGVIFGLRMPFATVMDLSGLIKSKYSHAELLHTVPVDDRYELRVEHL